LKESEESIGFSALTWMYICFALAMLGGLVFGIQRKVKEIRSKRVIDNNIDDYLLHIKA